ncbi:SRPBCC domain-containing protein [Cellulomonas sp. Leaf395]|uniref:SRPBCC domain-containing protein n=1 Tax=Cellulomonas sp. Leaf395 TaxID=1736362 RepID=UPI0006FA3F25|nr:SRPBCC domain-containing protein [Cellulomonas sp. Leaf395]KQT02311.1 ATPase [Cellulomonas sp. Leaf395]
MPTETTSATSAVAHATFVVERTFDADLTRVWDAFAVPEQHAQWFGSDPGFTETEAHEEFRVGGQAVQDGQWHDGPTSRYVATYTDIVERSRIVSTYDMWVGGEHLSTSLSTIELEAVDGGTRVTYTEQGVFLDGKEDGSQREAGFQGIFDTLATYLAG